MSSFMGAFEFADESAGYKTMLRLMAPGISCRAKPETRNTCIYLVAAKGLH